MNRALLKSPPVAATLALAILFAGYFAWAAWSGARKLTDAEIAEAAQSSGDPDRLDLRIVLQFKPEQFHFMRLQDIGRMAGADDHSVNLRGVSVAAARSLARRYWVSDIEPLELQ